jgi:hypothetical protein
MWAIWCSSDLVRKYQAPTLIAVPEPFTSFKRIIDKPYIDCPAAASRDARFYGFVIPIQSMPAVLA